MVLPRRRQLQLSTGSICVRRQRPGRPLSVRLLFVLNNGAFFLGLSFSKSKENQDQSDDNCKARNTPHNTSHDGTCVRVVGRRRSGCGCECWCWCWSSCRDCGSCRWRRSTSTELLDQCPL